MKVGFWNLGGATDSPLALRELLALEAPDILGLAEYARSVGHSYSGYSFVRISSRLALLYRGVRIAPIKHSVPPALEPFFSLWDVGGRWIAFCHIKSLLNDGGLERDHQLREIASHLKGVVNPWQNLLVMGDVNANPWEPAIVGRRSLHGHQTLEESKQNSVHKKRIFPRLLNLSYQLAITSSSGSIESWGTYRHKEKKLDGTIRWHIFDQALVTSDLSVATLKAVQGSVSVPWQDGLGVSGKKRQWPDHLPIIVEC